MLYFIIILPPPRAGNPLYDHTERLILPFAPNKSANGLVQSDYQVVNTLSLVRHHSMADDDLPELPPSFSKNGEDEPFPRRRLLSVNTPTPTGRLDQPLMTKFDMTTSHLPLFKFQAYDGRKLTMGDYPTKKITYSHQTDLNIANNLSETFQSKI